MAKTLSIEVKGIDKVMASLTAVGRDAPRELGAALYQEANELITEAKTIVPVDLGTLRSSGTVKLPEIMADKVVVEAGFGGAAAPYALYVHEGTGPAVGHAPYFPPPSALEGWARSHGFDSAWAVAWAIYKHGTKPTKYLEEPFNRRAAGFSERIAAALAAKLK